MAVVVVVVSFLVGRFRPSGRKRLRRLVAPYTLYLEPIIEKRAAPIISDAAGSVGKD